MNQRDAIGKLEGRLEALGKPLLHIVADTDAVDDRFDGVFLVLVEIWSGVEVGDDPVDTRAHEAVTAQLREDM